MLRQIKLNVNRFVKNNVGMSLVEVMVAAGLAAIVSLGIARMMQNAAEEQKKTNILATLKELKARQENVLRDPGAWANTIADSTNRLSSPLIQGIASNCISAAPCDTTLATASSPLKIILKARSGETAFDNLAWSATTGNGFSEAGQKCTTFNSVVGSGVDSCPIGYKTVFMAACPSGATTCSNPGLRVVSRLIFNPADKGLLHKYRGLVSSGTQNNIGSTSVDGRYDVVVERTGNDAAKTMNFVSKFSTRVSTTSSVGAGVQPCQGGGFGVCSTAGAVHPTTVAGGYNQGWVEVTDSHNLLDTTGGGGQFSFTEDGIYTCRISVPAFATGKFTVELRSGASTVVATTSGYVNRYNMTNVVLNATFQAKSTDDFYIYQKCADNLSGIAASMDDTSISSCTLGMGGTPYTNQPSGVLEPVVDVYCMRSDSPTHDSR